MPSYNLRRINRIADRYLAHWRLKSGEIFIDEITEVEYRSLAQKGASSPMNRTGDPEAVWLFAEGGVATFNTPSKRMEYGDVTDGFQDFIVICAPKIFREKDKVKIPINNFSGTINNLSFKGNPLPNVTLKNGVLTVPD